MYTLPKDPVMLLSFVNLKLRDEYPTLDDFCSDCNIQKDELTNKLAMIDYHYVDSLNQFK